MKSERTELNDKTLLWFIFRYPLTTIHVIVVTHWHVLVIFFKGTDYRTKNEESDFQEGYYETRPPDSANKTSFLSKVLFSDLIKQNMKKLGFKRNKE
jgi:hypothetical protein